MEQNLSNNFLQLGFKGGGSACTLNNGLALTPPMGWLAWERFKCNTDCENDPDNCISEKLFMRMADVLIKEGYRDAGYLYVNLDDCWMARRRDQKGNLVADPERFPHGIKFLADYMHTKGLRLGIYQNFGLKTCMQYPGIAGHLEKDTKSFADWKVDMVKLDGCFTDPSILNNGYINVGKFLNKTQRPMLYSCSWPYYQLISGKEPHYKLISTHCNMWRNFHDIADSWEVIEGTIKFMGDNQEVLSQHIGPGHWNDPDMLMIGNFHLSHGEARIQMSVWSILPAPLLMSNDLRSIDKESKKILLNKVAISINQDHLGLPGKRVLEIPQLEVWTRPILPVNKKKETSFAVLFINKSKKSKKVVKLVGILQHKSQFWLSWATLGFMAPNLITQELF
ncbi:hypothetical protein JTE90_020591 [Oedothorax gibbosus]|uniref:Alpha-galactosidase n=1 Tax=Oedothorax gibbosus TaxID=931172 RepID=A0AAV6VXP9_9ARAC|nr:hypothetical protein JTE90_020591 [Oedothorax gibbosus]